MNHGKEKETNHIHSFRNFPSLSLNSQLWCFCSTGSRARSCWWLKTSMERERTAWYSLICVVSECRQLLKVCFQSKSLVCTSQKSRTPGVAEEGTPRNWKKKKKPEGQNFSALSGLNINHMAKYNASGFRSEPGATP